ncbi:MAG: SAM-dependent methyltransferase [Campylobacterota bacterium]|nr:SAM-dependent methyltransferase [Campylobacterota bacterium]
MNFSKYMTQWLYGEEGYYSTYKAIGKEGDFYTSVSSSKFFGGSIAKHIISLVEEGFLNEDATICEIGAHHGYLLADIVEFIYTLKPELLNTFEFVIVERYDAMQESQIAYFQESFGDVVKLSHVKSLSDLHVKNAFFLANEIFDAFACELFYKGKTAQVENHNVEFNLENAWVSEKAAKYFKDRGEIAVGYEAFALEMAGAAERFEFMSFDYGEMKARPDFSLRIYDKHKVHPFFEENLDRKALFGKSDITYDVTFGHVKDAYEEAGVTFVELKAQMTALVNMGILELLEMLQVRVEEKLYKQELDKVKMLIMPDMLGERFKCIRFRKI